MLGCFYLHENGDLIWKPAAAFMNTTPADYFDSPFVIKWWSIPLKPPFSDKEKNVMWVMNWMREAYELSNDKARTEKRIREICQKQGFPEVIANAIIAGKKTV